MTSAEADVLLEQLDAWMLDCKYDIVDELLRHAEPVHMDRYLLAGYLALTRLPRSLRLKERAAFLRKATAVLPEGLMDELA
jgi:hypothetical protein